jgi:hypothetical protein
MTVTAFSARAFAKGVHVTTWAVVPFASPSTGTPQSAAQFNDKCVQVSGTFGAAGSATIEGSNDNTNWFPLHDPAGAALTITAAGLKEILENPLYIRPNVTAGDGTTALTVTLVQRSGFI